MSNQPKLQTGTLTPAYGRNYKTAKDAIKDFVDGKDWKYVITGQYCSIRDFEKGANVILRYGTNFSKLTLFEVNDRQMCSTSQTQKSN